MTLFVLQFNSVTGRLIVQISATVWVYFISFPHMCSRSLTFNGSHYVLVQSLPLVVQTPLAFAVRQ